MVIQLEGADQEAEVECESEEVGPTIAGAGIEEVIAEASQSLIKGAVPTVAQTGTSQQVAIPRGVTFVIIAMNQATSLEIVLINP